MKRLVVVSDGFGIYLVRIKIPDTMSVHDQFVVNVLSELVPELDTWAFFDDLEIREVE